MSKTIKYTVEFLTDWHCGSGLSSGDDLDLLVIKDKDHLPFIPGKTIKGLIREAVEEIAGYSKEVTEEQILAAFGHKDKKNLKSEEIKKGDCFFKNATLKDDLRIAIESNKLQEHLYRSVASTAIDNDGIAIEHSLRKMEVVVPCMLEGEILDVPENFEEIIEKGLKFIKRLGQNRNRGLGRCVITIEKEGGKK
ncbi:MAG: RAMP superfamily CRISPR-associated protein [Prevotella sp.]|jgi:CRISPR/Cas system CSM-associated protein Csm3 (group 7 of RAMP superfamily)|nr:RAMP superfamily CRISPR-associated protein [Prevotella sp.]